MEKINVKTGEFRLASAPHTLATSSIGSCVAVAVYNDHLKMGGLVHLMIPDTGASSGILIDQMIKEMIRRGARREHLRAKISGGANLFPTISSFDIGQENIHSVRQSLQKHRITVVGEDLRGSSARSVEFCLRTGIMTVKTRI